MKIIFLCLEGWRGNDWNNLLVVKEWDRKQKELGKTIFQMGKGNELKGKLILEI